MRRALQSAPAERRLTAWTVEAIPRRRGGLAPAPAAPASAPETPPLDEMRPRCRRYRQATRATELRDPGTSSFLRRAPVGPTRYARALRCQPVGFVPLPQRARSRPIHKRPTRED